MQKLKNALKILSTPKRKEREEITSFSKKTGTFKNSKRANGQKYFINTNYASCTKKKDSLTKVTTSTSKNKSIKKGFEKPKIFDSNNKERETKKLTITSRNKLGSSQKVEFLDRSGASTKESRKISLRNSSMGSTKKEVTKGETRKVSEKQSSNEFRVENKSKLRIVSRDKFYKKSPKSNGLKVTGVSRRKKSQDVEKPGLMNMNAADMYFKLEKLVTAKSRSIDLNKNNSGGGKRRLDIVSEDKDQTKYIMNEKPTSFIPMQKNKKQAEIDLKKQGYDRSKNKYYNYLCSKLKGNSNVTKMREKLKDCFSQWQSTNVPEFYNFKSSIEFYKIRQKIGKGCFGKVYLATQLITNTSVALKIIPKTNIKNKDTRKKIEKEVEILKKVNNNKHIIKLFEVFEDKSNVFLVFEYLENGDLVKYFKKNPLFEESEQKYFFNKILSGIKYIHEQKIIHRDLKLDNILLDRKMNPKICDFGISSIIIPGKKIYDTGGTPAYLAPEVIKAEGEVGPKSDVWSLGVLLYLLTFGIVPFKANDMQVLYNKIIVGRYKFPECGFVSPELLNLIQRMLITNVDSRLSMEEVIEHEWFNELTLNATYHETMKENKSKNNMKRMGIILYLEDLGFPADYIRKTMDKGLFNHVKACIDSLMIKFNTK